MLPHSSLKVMEMSRAHLGDFYLKIMAAELRQSHDRPLGRQTGISISARSSAAPHQFSIKEEEEEEEEDY